MSVCLRKRYPDCRKSVRIKGSASRECHNLLQSGRSPLQRVVLRMHIGPHGERRISVPEPSSDNRDLLPLTWTTR
jgi:hypothetical protein